RHGVELRTDLRPALAATGTGHVLAIVTAHGALPQPWLQRKTTAWIQVTRLGASARVDREQLHAWVQDLTPTSRFLAPMAGAETSLVIEGRAQPGATATSDASGHVTLALPAAIPRDPKERRPSARLDVRQGTDTMFVAISGGYEREIRHHHSRWYVTDDRFTYKPGEQVFVKGWVRWSHDGVNPDLALPSPGETVTYQLTDPRGIKLASGTVPLSDQGGFDVAVDLPPNVNLGTSNFTFTTRRQSHRHPISVQEFRTPVFAVELNDDVTHAGATPLVVGERLEMQTTARYYRGGGLPGAALTWAATLTAAAYRPPGWDAFSFASPASRSERAPPNGARDLQPVELHQPAALSSHSTAALELGLRALPGDRPSVLSVDATVTDVDRMTIRASSRAILVHPSTAYVGLRLRPRQPSQLEVIVTDIDGAPLAGVPIVVELAGVLGSERYRDDAEVVDTQRCQLVSQATPVICGWQRKDAKTAYTATARIEDARGRRNRTQYAVPWYAHDDRQDLSIVPDRTSYQPGDVAKLEVRSRTLPGTAIVSFARQGVVAQRRVELTQASTTVELPIEPGHLQNVHVLVDRVARQRVPRAGSKLPFAEHTSARIELAVDVESARLTMRARPLRSLIEPGKQATFEVEVAHDGKPTPNAEVALIVVDEAILALSARSHADPLTPFYQRLGDGTTSLSSFHLLDDAAPVLAGGPGFRRFVLEDGGGFGFGTSGYGSGGGSIGLGGYGTIGHGSAQVVRSRKDFRPTAVFSPRLRTGADGKVQLSVQMPDSLTRFRIIALATANTRWFGKAESTIVTQRKVNARTVAPRFLNQGDAFSLPVVVQNLDTAPRVVDVAVRAANLTAVGEPGRRVTIPPGQRAEVRFDFTTQARGRAVIQTIAVAGDFADASTVELPVYEPATTESFATYGVVDDAPKFERLEVPTDVFPDVGGVEVELASTQLQALTDAFWYLYEYPYECAEQRSGRMIATSAMFDILDAFASPGRPTRAEIEATAAADIKRLSHEQRPDGGWGYFDGMRSDPFVTMQVLTALAAHRAAGPVTRRAVGFVTLEARRLLDRLEQAARRPAIQRTDRAAHAYVVSLAATALTTLARTGADVHARVLRLHAAATALGSYPIDAKARVLALVAGQPRALVMREGLLRELRSATHETAAAATVTVRHGEAERLLLASNTRTTALVLDALMREAPSHALVLKLARGVLDARRHGRWGSTQENLVVLQTMRRYFETYEKETPSYTGKLWFGGATYAEQAFMGRSTARGQAAVDWPTLGAGSTHDLALVKTGVGRMYYRIGITYAPKQTRLPALDAGFIVRRTYSAVDDPDDVITRPDGRVEIRLGARVLVGIQALNTTRRHAVALVDPLPAGLEVVNDNLATAERGVRVAADTRWDFRNLRDNRSEVFAMELAEGTHRFTYTARATTPGTFFAAPAKAEEMYSPETFGRSTGQTVVIK
ncbi:MAG: hypothetical protein M3680_18090, partial [Myxococcota bacterium]|nr:hypothetical protein [Myxococcota bacterium]